MRLFFAIQLTEEIKRHLWEEIQHLKKISVAGNFSHRENLHLTLAFLGEVEDKKVKVLSAFMKDITWKAFPIELSVMDAFRIKDEFIPYVEVVTSEELLSLQSDLIKRLKEAGFSSDEKEFIPHITLGRRVVFEKTEGLRKQEELKKELKKQTIVQGKSMLVDTISLMKSERMDGRLTYTEIGRQMM